MTPPVPAWVHGFTLSGYTNIYELVPDEPRIYGTESLYGDWQGRLLVLAKDFASRQFVLDRASDGQRLYRHEPGLRTNRVLETWLSSIVLTADPRSCGVLYGSALAGLLRNDGQMSGALPNRKEAIRYGSKVLGWVIEQMPRLSVIACMGREAMDCMLSHCRRAQDELVQIHGNAFRLRDLVVVNTYHPVAIVEKQVKDARWEQVRHFIDKSSIH